MSPKPTSTIIRGELARQARPVDLFAAPTPSSADRPAFPFPSVSHDSERAKSATSTAAQLTETSWPTSEPAMGTTPPLPPPERRISDTPPADHPAPSPLNGEDREAAIAAGRVEGYEAGFADGIADGRRAALAEATEAHAITQQTLAKLVDQLTQQNSQTAQELSRAVVERAIDIASMIIGRELAVAENPGADALARCLAIAPNVTDMVAHVHPEDLALLDAGSYASATGHEFTLVADDRLERGDAVVMTDQTIIDARLATAFERVAEVLR